MNIDLLNIIKDYKFMKIKVVNNNITKFNEIIKQIYVINLFEDIINRNYIQILFKKYKINYNLIIVDRICKNDYDKLCPQQNISKEELGCCVSHLWCLSDILKNNYENAIIFEDDVILHKNFIEKFIKIYEKQDKIDFLMLGAHDYNFTKTHYKNISSDNLYRPNPNSRKLFGAHANYYTNLGAKRMFYIRTTNLSFFDNEYNLLFDSLPNSYICYPNLAISNVNHSRINHKKHFFSKQEISYYSLCFKNIILSDYNLIYINLLDLSLLKPNDTFEMFIERCLFATLLQIDRDKIIAIKKRFVLDFFTLEDLKQILSSQSLIVPNTLSKKCIGENS